MLSDLWQPFPGGAERLMFNLARDLMRRGEDVHVLTGYENAEQLDGPPVSSAPIGVFDTREQGAAIVSAFVAALEPDVIVAHHLYAFQFERELLSFDVPLVHVVLNGKRIEHAALAVYISQWVRDRGNVRDGDLVITPPVFAADVQALRHGECIGFIKPIEHKGVELFYAIAEAMPEREFLVLRGEWQDLEDIRALPNVAFMEPVRMISEFYEHVRMVLMPSLSEDAGTVAQECAVNRIPCVSSNVDGLAETNAGGITLNPGLVSLDGWLAAIRVLDYPRVYEGTVERQWEHFCSTQQDAKLYELHSRIVELT